MSYKIYCYTEIEVCNGGNIKILKELTEFGAEYGTIMEYLTIKFGYDREDIFHLNSEEMTELLEIIENKTLFDYIDIDNWIDRYGRYFYDYVKYGKYVIYSPSEDKDIFKTKEELLDEFLENLKEEIICIKDNIEYDKIKDFYIGWK